MLIHGLTGGRRHLAIAAAAVAAVAAAGCGVAPATAGGPTVIVIRDNANGTTVRIAAGDRVELILSSSYWDVAGSSAPRVLRQDGPATLMPRPSSCPQNIPGLGCIPIQTKFTALADGKAVIRASRTSCGEALRCSPDRTRFSVMVVVRDQG
ncbi:MAG TPA: hypothetical protein VH307_23935 [Streptosporangiaceae bacterium]|jgi:hypothetical protein|nr:hypothetical protein [Streptosporangiaceae bacterium]